MARSQLGVGDVGREGLNSHRMPKNSGPLIGKHRTQRSCPCPHRSPRSGVVGDRHSRPVCLHTAPGRGVFLHWGTVGGRGGELSEEHCVPKKKGSISHPFMTAEAHRCSHTPFLLVPVTTVTTCPSQKKPVVLCSGRTLLPLLCLGVTEWRGIGRQLSGA